MEDIDYFLFMKTSVFLFDIVVLAEMSKALD